MKSKVILLVIMAIAASMLLVACKDEIEEYPVEDAKVEIRSASQQIQNNMDELMATEAATSLNSLMNLLSVPENWKSSLQFPQSPLKQFNIAGIGRFLRHNFPTNITTKNSDEGGLFVYDFDSLYFILVEPIDDLVFRFPSDDLAHANRENNAELRIADLQIVEIEYTDEYGGTYYEPVPVNAVVTLKVDNQTVMTLDYNATFNNEGLPTSMAIDLHMAPYRFILSFSGSGVTYTSSMSIRKGDEKLLGYNLTITYSANFEQIHTVSGTADLVPLRLSGHIQPESLEDCPENDINCLNNNVDLQLIHAGDNKIIGNIEFRLYYDEEWEETYPVPVIVYSDGTWEYLFLIFQIPA